MRLFPRSKIVFPAIFLTLLFVQCIYSAWNNGQTVDETFYNGQGYAYIRHNDFRFSGEHPALIMQIASLPLVFANVEFPYRDAVTLPHDRSLIDLTLNGSKFLYEKGNNPHTILFLERIPIILLTIFLAILLYLWAFELYGLAGALTSLSLAAFSPNIIAHGSLYTTDMGVTVFMFFTVYRAKKMFSRMNAKNIIWTGAACGLALMSKVSAVLLLPILFLLILIYGYERFSQRQEEKAGQAADVFLGAKTAWFMLVMFILSLGHKTTAVALGPLCLTVLAFFWFTKAEYKFKYEKKLYFVLTAAGWIVCFIMGIKTKQDSLLFKAGTLTWAALFLTMQIWILKAKYRDFAIMLIRIFVVICCTATLVIIFCYTDFYRTLPQFKHFGHYIRAFNIAFSHSTETRHIMCLADSFIKCDWRYFITTMLVKMPVPSLILIVPGIFCLMKSKLSLTDKAVVLVPAIVFFFAASFVNKINIGLRHVLPVLPFLFMAAGAVIPALNGLKSKRLAVCGRAAVIFLLIFLAQKSVRSAPDYISFFNSAVGSVEKGAMLTGDSNLDWGQDNLRLIRWAKENKIQKVNISIRTQNLPEFNYYGLNVRPVEDTELLSPVSGIYALDVHALLRMKKHPESYFSTHAPEAKAGRTIYVFNVSRKP